MTTWLRIAHALTWVALMTYIFNAVAAIGKIALYADGQRGWHPVIGGLVVLGSLLLGALAAWLKNQIEAELIEKDRA